MSIIVRVDDVGRKPNDPPDKDWTDNDLDYFFKWREALNLRGGSAVYGVTPAYISSIGFHRLKTELNSNEFLAVHGWDHARGIISFSDLRKAVEALNYPRSYIPPFNSYDNYDIENWSKLGGKYFFGYDPSKLMYKKDFERKFNCIHILSATSLYGHVDKIMENLSPTHFSSDIPYVLTLHVPWDKFDSLSQLGDKIFPYVTPVTIVEDMI